MTVILFGFEPFREYIENPSQLVVQSLNNIEINNEPVRGIVLPVEYDKVEEIIITSIRKYKPILILGLGLAPGRAKLTPEKIAINYKYSKEPDNAGKKSNGEKIDNNGQDGIFTNIPVEELVDFLNSRSIPTELSLSAGSYLCNMAMYIIVREAKKSGALGGFIHLPCHERLASILSKPLPSMNLETMNRGIRLAIEFVLSKLTKQQNVQ
ncbi:pyroglutamyl-peptidase I [Sulfolobus tengchongensis]|uniref:Pyroglutamyl-peptidase I n=1 Tax=Sulfolobus tengchongensis TaxID=207809 RepID=A0AAX4KXL9_9CREN